MQISGIVNPISVLFAVFVNLALTGCGATLQTVPAPYPVECREAVAERPVMPTEQFKTKPGVDELLKSSLAENERREAYETKLLAALIVCTTPIAGGYGFPNANLPTSQPAKP